MLRVQNVSLVFFLIPCRFWWSWKMMILAAEGMFLTSFCGCNCKVCTFAHFFRKFLRSFWFPFAQSCRFRWPPTRVGLRWPRNNLPGWEVLHLRPGSYLDKLYSLVSQLHPNFEQSTNPTSVSDKFWFSVNIMRDLTELGGYWCCEWKPENIVFISLRFKL